MFLSKILDLELALMALVAVAVVGVFSVSSFIFLLSQTVWGPGVSPSLWCVDTDLSPLWSCLLADLQHDIELH